jgi:hypothetical protein
VGPLPAPAEMGSGDLAQTVTELDLAVSGRGPCIPANWARQRAQVDLAEGLRGPRRWRFRPRASSHSGIRCSHRVTESRHRH